MDVFVQIETFLKEQVLGVPLYRVALAVGAFLGFLLLRKLFIFFVLGLVKNLIQRTETEIDDLLFRVLSKPVSYIIALAGLGVALKILGVENQFVYKILKTFLIFILFWTFYNLVVAFEVYVYRFAERFGREFSREVGGFLVRILKAFVIIVGAVAVLQEWGINVGALLASLGLGGLAFALAARDTVANLFGGLTVLADKSMKVGDWVKIGDIEGIVEDIGIRTTKIRTFEKSLITLPNQVASNQPLENFSRRNVRRIKMTIGLTYDTTRDQMVRILKDIRDMLKNHPRIAKDQLLMVYFRDFSDSSLDIFIYCFTDTADWKEYLAIREDVNLKIMEIVERHGASFAFPSRSIYVEKMPPFKIEDHGKGKTQGADKGEVS